MTATGDPGSITFRKTDGVVVSREEADRNAVRDRLACIRVEWED